ncbi:MAG TPA: serine hydrolase domain-containing protein [Caulobacteraceae bacterium]|nr:serine hydrolase domain-containing protein [Caulobacteraceae bacterium]
MSTDVAVEEGPKKTVREQLDALFAPWNRNDEPGLAVGVARDGAVIYRRGFGMASLEAAVAVTPKTRMRIGSTSKHFTCLLALLLAEEGKLDMDAPIRTYLPELTGPGGDPTLRLLVQHRGGSRCYLDIGFIGHGMNAPPVGRGLVVQARQRGRNFAPGEAMIYNNGGYHLVSLAIERVGGAPFESQLKQRLFDVVGMPDTASIPSDHEITPGIATMHIPGRDGAWRRGIFPSEEVRGEGAIVSTVDDMLRWMAHLRSRDRFGSAKTWAELTEKPRYADGALGSYALGLMLDDYRGRPTIHHSGGVIGGTAQMLAFPEDGLDVIVLANGARAADVVRLAHQVADIVLAERLGPETPTVAADAFKSILGDYWSPEDRMTYSLVDEGGVLKLSIAKSPGSAPLVDAGDGRLVFPAGGIGEISVRPEGGALEIRFGPDTRRYRRLEAAPGDAEAFALAAQGAYRSDDADTSATIEHDGETLTLVLSDGFGRVAAPLKALSSSVGFSTPKGAMSVFRTTLSLDIDGGKAVGFRLNTPRTRDLVFQRL